MENFLCFSDAVLLDIQGKGGLGVSYSSGIVFRQVSEFIYHPFASMYRVHQERIRTTQQAEFLAQIEMLNLIKRIRYHRKASPCVFEMLTDCINIVDKIDRRIRREVKFENLTVTIAYASRDCIGMRIADKIGRRISGRSGVDFSSLGNGLGFTRPQLLAKQKGLNALAFVPAYSEGAIVREGYAKTAKERTYTYEVQQFDSETAKFVKKLVQVNYP